MSVIESVTVSIEIRYTFVMYMSVKCGFLRYSLLFSL